MVQKILSDKVMNERTNAYYSYYVSVQPEPSGQNLTN